MQLRYKLYMYIKTHCVNDFIEVEEEPHISVGTADKSKPITQSCYHTLRGRGRGRGRGGGREREGGREEGREGGR